MAPTRKTGGSREENPSNPEKWWARARSLGLDPANLDISTYKSNSASKFTETDFIYLKALWSTKSIDKFHVGDYARKEHVERWKFILAKTSSSSQGGDTSRLGPLQHWLMEFITTSSESFTDDDAKNEKLGAFMLVKSYIEAATNVNDWGESVAGDAPKIRRSARIMNQTLKAKETESDLAQRMGSLTMDETTARRPSTPPKPPRTPSPQGGSGSPSGFIATRDLDVISPESMALEKDRSRDEDTVNVALVSLLETTTMCSGIRKHAGQQGLKWHLTRQSFHLGPANNPVCEARTDGLLVLHGHPDCTLAILEVKPYRRDINMLKIEWQEACQMAACISTSLKEKTKEKRKEGFLPKGHEKRNRRVLISQDYISLYITIAEWGRGYEEYLCGKARPPTPPSQTASPSQNRGRTEAKPPTGPTKAGEGTRTSQSPGKPAPDAPGQAQHRSKGVSAAQPHPGVQHAPAPPTSTPQRDATAEELDSGNLLTMNCYGPYSTRDPTHIAMFLRIALTLMVELSDPLDS